MPIFNFVSDDSKNPGNQALREMPMFVCPDCKRKLDDLTSSSRCKQLRSKSALSHFITAASMTFGNDLFWYGMLLAFTFHQAAFNLISSSLLRLCSSGIFIGGIVFTALCSQVMEVLV